MGTPGAPGHSPGVGHPNRPPEGLAVVVVGASSGIGLATARRLSERGDRVVVVAREQERLEAVAAALPGPAVAAAADLATGRGVEEALARCVAAYGRVDAVITTAQSMAYGSVEDVPPDLLGEVVAVAVQGTSRLARAALPHLRASGGGHLVVVGSLLAEVSVPQMGAYCAAKWGQAALVRALQLETRRERGIHVSLVVPGAVDTPIYAQAATYAGSEGSAPPPIVAPDRVAAAVEDCLRRPRRSVQVGPVNRVVRAGFRHLPGLYDRIAGPMVQRIVLRGPERAPDPGNVVAPLVDGEAERGGWTTWGRMRDATGRPRWRR